MKLATLTLDKLPKRTAFGRAAIYSDDDIAQCLAVLTTGVAISNSQTYDTREKARSAAGTLRSRLKKMNPDAAAATYCQFVEKPKDAWTFYIVPPPVQRAPAA